MKAEKLPAHFQSGLQVICRKRYRAVTMTDITEASNVERMTLFPYSPSNAELAIAISARKWKEYIIRHNSLLYERFVSLRLSSFQLLLSVYLK